MKNNNSIASVVLAAGHGTRMKSSLPKVLHPVGNLPMLGHVLKTASTLEPEKLCVVTGDHAPEVAEAAMSFAPSVAAYVQAPPQGTGHAVQCAMPGLDGFEGIVFVLYADTPLITEETLRKMASKMDEGVGVAVLGFVPDDAGAYGRLVVGQEGFLDRIVEAKDASPEELEIDLCNSGVMAIHSSVLKEHIFNLSNDNANKEFYLTDLVEMAKSSGSKAVVIEGDEEEVLGVNSRFELAQAEQVFQWRMREKAMLDGVTLQDPDTTYFSHDTQIENDVTIGANVVFGPRVIIASGAVVHPFSHLEGVEIAGGASVGPFVRLRPGAQIGEGAKIGNFVEVKKATIDKGGKVSHLSYIGDAEVGADANIGAGTITCNYDGFSKHKTIIGEGAFIGSNSSLVAPVEIGAGAYVGSGSVITKSVSKGALAVSRGKQIQKENWAVSFRKKMTK